MDRIINIKNRDRVPTSSKSSGISKISNLWIIKLAAIALSFFFLFTAYNSIVNTIQKRKILDRAEKEVEELRLANLHLSIQIKDMSSDRYLEKEARDRLNFGGKDEVVFVIPDNTLDSAKEELEEILNPQEESIYEPGNNINDWVQFILLGI